MFAFASKELTVLEVNDLMDLIAAGDWTASDNGWNGVEFVHATGAAFYLAPLGGIMRGGNLLTDVFNMETLRALPSGCFCYSCECVEEDGEEVCGGYCEGVEVECRQCDFSATRFYIDADFEEERDNVWLEDFQEVRDFADAVTVLAVYPVSPIIGELIRDELKDESNGFTSPYWIEGNSGFRHFYRRGAFTIDMRDLSAVKFVGAAGAMRVEFDAIDLMDADNLGELIAWIQSGKLRGCPAGKVLGQKRAV